MTDRSAPADVRQNRILAALPEADRERVLRNLQPVFIVAGKTLYEPGVQLDCAYSP